MPDTGKKLPHDTGPELGSQHLVGTVRVVLQIHCKLARFGQALRHGPQPRRRVHVAVRRDVKFLRALIVLVCNLKRCRFQTPVCALRGGCLGVAHTAWPCDELPCRSSARAWLHEAQCAALVPLQAKQQEPGSGTQHVEHRSPSCSPMAVKFIGVLRERPGCHNQHNTRQLRISWIVQCSPTLGGVGFGASSSQAG